MDSGYSTAVAVDLRLYSPDAGLLIACFQLDGHELFFSLSLLFQHKKNPLQNTGVGCLHGVDFIIHNPPNRTVEAFEICQELSGDF